MTQPHANAGPRPKHEGFADAQAFASYLENRRGQTGHCLSLEDLLLYHDGRLTPEREEIVKDHLAVCNNCSLRLLNHFHPKATPNGLRTPVLTALLFLGGLLLGWAFNPFYPVDNDPNVNVTLVRLEPVDRVYRDNAVQDVVHYDPGQNLALQLNTADQGTAQNYRVELLQGADGPVVWSADGLERKPDGSFLITLPKTYRHGALHLRLRADQRVIAEYQLQLTQP